MNLSLYILPIRKAATLFPYAVLILTIPFLVHKYRKYGSVSIHHFLFSYLLIFYLMCVYCLVILPLPDLETVAQSTRKIYHLIPFSYVQDILTKETVALNNPSTWVNLLFTTEWLEPLFNVVMLIPFGMYLRYYRRWSLWKTVRFSFYLSLFFEMTQLSGLYLIYPRPYRMFDINDLMENTAGGLAGWYIGALFTKILPAKEKTDHAAYMNGSVAGFGRRFTAFILDDIVINIPVLLLCSLIHLPLQGLVCTLAMTIIIYLNHGVSFGTWAVQMRMADTRTGETPKLVPLLIRELIVWGWFRYAPATVLSIGNTSLQTALLILYPVSLLVLLIDLILSRKRDDKQFFFEERLHLANIPVLRPRTPHTDEPWSISEKLAVPFTLLAGLLVLSGIPCFIYESWLFPISGALFCLLTSFFWIRRRRDAAEIALFVPMTFVPFILFNYDQLWFIFLLIYYIFALIGAAAGYALPKRRKLKEV